MLGANFKLSNSECHKINGDIFHDDVNVLVCLQKNMIIYMIHTKWYETLYAFFLNVTRILSNWYSNA